MRPVGAPTQQVFADNGATIVNVPSSDAYSALQTGAIDGILTSLDSMKSFHLYEQLKYVALSPTGGGLYYGVVPVLMSKKVWSGLSTQQQKIIDEAAHTTQSWVTEETVDETKTLVAFFKQKGIDTYRYTEAEYQAWLKASQPALVAYQKISPAAAAIAKGALELQGN